MPIPGLVTAGASLLGQAFGAAGTEFSNRKAFERMREHDIEMFNLLKQDRDEQNRYNAPAAQVARLAVAGINPASVFGNGVPVAESAPVSGSASASAKGTDWNITSRMAQDALVPLQMEQAAANIELTRANRENVEADTARKTKETAWIDRLNQAKEDSLKSSTRLDQGRYDMLATEKKEKLAYIEKLQREADSEIEKQWLMQSQRMLNDASVRELNSLLPLKAALMSAETTNQKAQGTLAFYNAMYQKDMCDLHYVQALVDKVIADTGVSVTTATKQDLENYRSALKNHIIKGDPIDFDGWPGKIMNVIANIGLVGAALIPGATHFLDR